jgi:hypothetical protein
MKRQAILAAVAVAALGFGVQKAHAHATSIGYTNAGPGSVTVWLGTYAHGGHHNEGSMKLEGVNGTVYAATTIAFTILGADGVKPAGLVDGTNHFYVQGGQGSSLPLVPTEAQWLALNPCCPTNHWQGATFAGLSAGDYKFTWVPANSPTAEWSPWSESMNGIFTLTGVIVNPDPTPVPEPTTLSLLGLGLLGAVVSRRRRNG